MKCQQKTTVKCLVAILLCWAYPTELSVVHAFTFTPQSCLCRPSFNGCSPATTNNAHCALPNAIVSETENGPLTSRGVIMDNKKSIRKSSIGMLASAVALATTILFTVASPVMADEYGVEKEAPTVFTGETVLICTKRGPLGACLKTEQRTAENDNDKSLKYFQDPSEVVKRKEEKMRAQMEEGNALVEKLRRQTEENREKNELLVKQKTLMNDQAASFGPFDRQVVILNEDGKGFTLLQNPQAMRLKKAGLIKDRQFFRQPTAEELEQALEAEGPSLGDALQGLFGGGGGGGD